MTVKSLAAFLMLAPAFHANASYCSVYFDSDPQGAQIYAGNSLIGVTPFSYAIGHEAVLKVKIVKKGFMDWRGEVHVPHNGVISFSRKLEPKSRAVAAGPSRARNEKTR